MVPFRNAASGVVGATLLVLAAGPAHADGHDMKISAYDHIAARQFCLTAVLQEKEQEKLSEERFLQLAHLCSAGRFDRAFTELGGSAHDGLVVHHGPNGPETMHEWERNVRSAIARAPHLEMK